MPIGSFSELKSYGFSCSDHLGPVFREAEDRREDYQVGPGESLEETVAREVREEVGLEVTDIRYFGSQPWPFPHSLMIGFTASYAGGEIRLQADEIAEAAWFHKHGELPKLPGKLSIARRLIDSFLGTQ